jgi:hypothetical protein
MQFLEARQDDRQPTMQIQQQNESAIGLLSTGSIFNRKPQTSVIIRDAVAEGQEVTHHHRDLQHYSSYQIQYHHSPQD